MWQQQLCDASRYAIDEACQWPSKRETNELIEQDSEHKEAKKARRWLVKIELKSIGSCQGEKGQKRRPIIEGHVAITNNNCTHSRPNNSQLNGAGRPVISNLCRTDSKTRRPPPFRVPPSSSFHHHRTIQFGMSHKQFNIIEMLIHLHKFAIYLELVDALHHSIHAVLT